MALDSAPPPSPVGKAPPPTKHQCDAASPCVILLSEVSKRHHTFPKGSFRARFIPPAIPILVCKHLSTHPLFWSWTVKAGPSARKSFRVPTVPTLCGKGSPQAIQWHVSSVLKSGLVQFFCLFWRNRTATGLKNSTKPRNCNCNCMQLVAYSCVSSCEQLRPVSRTTGCRL